MRYLIQQWVEALHDNEQCPRLMIDATTEGVMVPEQVKDKWGEAMPIDLDPTFPLKLRMTERGIDCSLSFGGPHDCHFPWRSIYVVQDRETQIGIVVEDNLPADFNLDDGATFDQSTRVTRKPSGTTQPLRVASTRERMRLVRQAPPEPIPAAEVAIELPAEERGVATRRAAFRVIDGGKD